MVEAERRLGTNRTTGTRYYLLSHAPTARAFGEAVRSHRGIKTQVHWALDMAFREDHSRIRQGAAAENFAVLRHIALNLLKQQPTKRLRIKDDYLLQVLQGL